jgi:hypothetical protein
MALQPAVVNLPPIYQNAAYDVQMRLVDRLRNATIRPDGVIDCPCHGLAVNAKVVLLSEQPTVSLCGAVLNSIYYVSPLNFSASTLRLTTATTGGTVLNISSDSKHAFYVAQPVDITGYTIDADICKPQSQFRIQVGTFVPSIDDAVNGAFALTMTPTESIKLMAEDYAYDVSMTPTSGDRFYAIQGIVPVAITRSRT